METSAYLDQVTTGGRRIAELAAQDLDRPVPTCGAWTTADLIAHLGGVYRWSAGIVSAGGARPEDEPGYTGDPDGLISWFIEAHAGLVAALETHAADDPAWVFVSRAAQNVGWWQRRQAHETAVHLYDVTASDPVPARPEPEMAADGVEEYLTVFLPRVMARNPIDALQGTLHLHATDTPGEWSMDLADPGAPPRREHSKADTALRGPAAGLQLWLWNRQSPDEAGLEVFGNESVVAAFTSVKA